MAIHRCPHCKSSRVRRSRQRGLIETVVLRLLLQRPYRCWSCYRRHYASIFSRRGTSAVERTPVSIRAGRPSFQGSLLLLILLAIPFLLAGSSPLLRTLDRLPLGGLRMGSRAVQNQLATRPTPAAPTQLALTSWEPALQPMEVLRPTGEVSANRMGPLAEASYPAPGSPAPQRQPLGALRTVGAVYLNEAKVPGEVTIFLGDALRTGAGSTAALTVPGKGTLLISQQTQLSFGGAKAYFAELKQGTVSLRAFAGVKDFDVQIGNFVVTSDPAMGADADIERAADGSARVMVTTGSVGVIGVGQPEVVFVHAGQEVAISATGRLLTSPPTQEVPSASPSVGQPGKKGGSHMGLIVLGVAGAGGAAAAAALAGGGGGASKPASPFVP